MKKTIPVRMPDWPAGELPTTKQVEVYLLFWDHQKKQLAPHPGAICWQPGDVYPTGRTATAKSCLVLVDAHGRELAR